MKKSTIVFFVATVLMCSLIGLKAQSDKPRYPVSDVYPSYQDTPKSKIKIGDRPPKQPQMVASSATFWSFVITDSSGRVAERDSLGVWEIKDCKRALETVYQHLKKQYNYK